MVKNLTTFILVLIFSACSNHSQPIQNLESDTQGITLETSYLLYVIDKNHKKYKFKLEKGHRLQIVDGIETYKHHKLGDVKVIKRVKPSEKVIGGGWDHINYF